MALVLLTARRFEDERRAGFPITFGSPAGASGTRGDWAHEEQVPWWGPAQGVRDEAFKGDLRRVSLLSPRTVFRGGKVQFGKPVSRGSKPVSEASQGAWIDSPGIARGAVAGTR